ncbi:MAG: histidinol dehydrogenase, partial [Alphaproteobacteria bacterium]|nr:histidinol dehydrogenase [Alphaproteobacteria bacterium]
MPRRLNAADAGFEAEFRGLLAAKREVSVDVNDTVATILAEVRQRGDEAVIEYTERFDRVKLTPETMRFTATEIEAAVAACGKDTLAALDVAAERIQSFHEKQKPADLVYTDEAGVRLGQRWTAVGAAGLYVPGGTAAYPSSVLMNAIPARVAGVER